MSTRSVGPPFEVFRTPYYRQTSPQRPLKRKFDSLVSPTPTRVPLGYPSPPMSGPPSPLPPPSEDPVHSSAETHVASQPAFAPAPTSFRSTAPHLQPWTTSERTSFAAPSLGPAASQPSELGTLQTSQSFATASLPPVYGTVATGSSASRTGRKSKAHVASACVNCKRAHLSCDVQRPCGRCVASGKQVSEVPASKSSDGHSSSAHRIPVSTSSTRNAVVHVCVRIPKSMPSKLHRGKGLALPSMFQPKHLRLDLSQE